MSHAGGRDEEDGLSHAGGRDEEDGCPMRAAEMRRMGVPCRRQGFGQFMGTSTGNGIDGRS